MANPPSHSARSPGTDTTNPTPKAEAAKGDEDHPTRWASIVLRGANDYMLDEMERSVHDCLCAVKRTLENRSVVPGGGAVEMAVSVYLENFATTIGSREQLALSEFANACVVIPKTLAVNAAKDSTDLVSKLRAYHHAAAKSLLSSSLNIADPVSASQSAARAVAKVSGGKVGENLDKTMPGSQPGQVGQEDEGPQSPPTTISAFESHRRAVDPKKAAYKW